MKRNKAFTLIELVSVLVILAILALIVTPLVLNIIRKAKTAADRRSVDAYGKAVELAIAAHIMDTGQIPTDLDNLEVEYSGKEVVCAVKQIKENGGLYMSHCIVNGKDVKDSDTDDGWYHYGTRDLTSVEYAEMYAKALEEASLAYYEANGSKVSDYTTLDIDYKGKEVSCDVTINYDGTIYLESCSVKGIEVQNYTYGEIAHRSYSIGDEVNYNNASYYVIKDSNKSESSVTLLKSIPLTSEELSFSTNRVSFNGPVGLYGTEEKDNASDYSTSDIKTWVDRWVANYLDSNDLVEDETGYSARLITFEELKNNLGFTYGEVGTSMVWKAGESTPNWVWSSNYNYWTMSAWEDSDREVWTVDSAGNYINGGYEYYGVINYSRATIFGSSTYVIRPVITINKSALN